MRTDALKEIKEARRQAGTMDQVADWQEIPALVVKKREDARRSSGDEEKKYHEEMGEWRERRCKGKGKGKKGNKGANGENANARRMGFWEFKEPHPIWGKRA